MSGAAKLMKMFGSIAAMAAIAIVFMATPSHALDIKKITLSNGATLLVSEQHQLPMVTVMIEFDAGSRRDPKDKEGLAELTARSLSQGTKSLTAPEFDQKVDFMGSSVAVSADRDYATAGMTPILRASAPSKLRKSNRRRSSRATRPMWNSARTCSALRRTGIRTRARRSRLRS
jgi:zinc protease